MGISNFTLKRIFDESYPSLIDSKIEKIISLDESSFLFSLFKEGKSSSLLITLDPALPLMIKSKNFKIDAINKSTYNQQMLEKYLDHATINALEKVENDRIIILKAKKWTEAYQLIESTMIFELFPLSPNIIFVDKDFKILDAFKHSTSLDSKHPIYKGLTYSFPPSNDKSFTSSTPLEDMKSKLSKGEFKYLSSLSDDEYHQTLENMLHEKKYYLYKNEISSLKFASEAIAYPLDEIYDALLKEKTYKAKEEKYEHIFKLVEQKIKSIKKRIINIESDKSHFDNFNNYKEQGELLYLGNENYKRGDTKVTIEGVQITLDPKLDLIQNAQKYFKLYKKAKTGIIQVELQKESAEKELDYFEDIAKQLEFASSSDIEEIIFDLFDHHYLKDQKIAQKKNRKPGNSKYRPHYIKLPSGNKIGYGLSAYQNEELTFNEANKEDYYFHIKDYHGPHVILFTANPSEEEMRIAGEVALYFASKDSGEVYYTKRKNLKKIALERGKVSMQSMKTMVIGNISPNTINLIKNSK